MKILGFVALCLCMAIARTAVADSRDVDVALSLAEMLRAARAVIAHNQARINDATLGDKGLTGPVVWADAAARYERRTGESYGDTLHRSERHAFLLNAQKTAILAIMDNYQPTINRQGVGFKGFVPAVFARLVNQRFREIVGNTAEIKITAPMDLVRNRDARPDEWEQWAISEKLETPTWIKGQDVHVETTKNNRPAFRVLVPEYYDSDCLTCHGAPKGEIDVTGYPKEGGTLGELGGAISVTLYR